MKTLPITVALMISAVAGYVTAVAAMPIAQPQAGAPPVVQVRGCHRDAQRHYVPEMRDRLSHVHRGANCRPVPVANDRRRPADCHRDIRVHRVDGVMLRHRHVGNDCAVRVVRRGSVN